MLATHIFYINLKKNNERIFNVLNLYSIKYNTTVKFN